VKMSSADIARREMTGQVVIVVVVVVLLALVGLVYNGLIRRRNRVDATWSDVDVLLRRRHDLVPNLVSTVSGYAGHEAAALRAVAEARSAAIAATGPNAIGQAESQLASGVRSVFAVAEAYPNLKANAAFVRLQEQLEETENGLEHARQFYNDSVFGYNNAVQTLPRNLVAMLFGFRSRQFFQAAGGERATPALRV
jgi:LemA protein